MSVRSYILCSKLLHGFLSFMNKCISSYHDLPYTNQDDSCIRTFAFTVPSKIHMAYSLNSLGIFLLVNVLSMYYAWLHYLKLHLTCICGTSFLGFLVYCSPWHLSPLDIKFCFFYLLYFSLSLKCNSMNTGIAVFYCYLPLVWNNPWHK